MLKDKAATKAKTHVAHAKAAAPEAPVAEAPAAEAPAECHLPSRHLLLGKPIFKINAIASPALDERLKNLTEEETKAKKKGL